MPWLYAREAPKTGAGSKCHNETCPNSKTLKKLFRCEECFTGHLYCIKCINDRHKIHPFHRIRSWNLGDNPCFSRVRPRDRQFELNLGHSGERCPNGVISKGLHFMHTNGMHEINTVFCGCGNRDHWKQLLDHDLFPATETRPGKIYSFQLLRLFHALNIISKLSARDFHQALLRLSNGAFPSDVPVRSFLLRIFDDQNLHFS